MSDKNLTDNEIKKAMEFLLSKAGYENHKCCKGCVNEEKCNTECGANIVENALDLINRKEAEKSVIVEHLKRSRKQLKSANEEVKNLTSANEKLTSDLTFEKFKNTALTGEIKYLTAELEKQKDNYMELLETSSTRADIIGGQKAEIERLEEEISVRDKIIDERGAEVIRHDNAIRSLHKQLETAKIEAYKECIEKAKSELKNISKFDFHGTYYYLVCEAFFDNLLKELVGE